MKVKINSVQKIATVYYYIETDYIDFPDFRRSESGNWERRMGESWESWDDGNLEKAFQEYQAGQPGSPIGEIRFRTPHEDGVYHIEHIDDQHVRLTKMKDS